MRTLRVVGTLAAGVAAGAAAAGVATWVGSPFAVGVVAAVIALSLGVVVGHRGWLPLAGALAYIGVGVAVLRGPVDPPRSPTQVGAAFLGVGTVVAALFVLRWRAGNLKRLSTRPVNAGRVRLALATVARTLRAGRSQVRRVAGVRPADVPVGALALVGLWVALVGGSVALRDRLVRGNLGIGLDPSTAAALAPVTLVPFLAALLVPAYLATDWFALDGLVDPPETYGVLARASGRYPPVSGTASTDIPGTPSGAGSDLENGTATTASAADTDAEGAGADDAPATTRDEAAPETPADTSERTQEADAAEETEDDSDDETIGSEPRHWPNAEANPWTDPGGSGSNADTSDGSETPDDLPAQSAAPSDETEAGDDDSGDDRIVFGDLGTGIGDDADATGWTPPPPDGTADDADDTAQSSNSESGPATSSTAGDDDSTVTVGDTDDPQDGVRAVDQVSDRVSRILDGDLDAAEVDLDRTSLTPGGTRDDEGNTDDREPDARTPSGVDGDTDMEVDTGPDDGSADGQSDRDSSQATGTSAADGSERPQTDSAETDEDTGPVDPDPEPDDSEEGTTTTDSVDAPDSG